MNECTEICISDARALGRPKLINYTITVWKQISVIMFHFSAHYKTYYLASCNVITLTRSQVTRCCIILCTDVLK